MSDLLGYTYPQYALSLKEFGKPRELKNCGGWILERPIPSTSYKDAMGCYPLFTCLNWNRLPDDLMEIESEFISLSLVTDPFGTFRQEDMEKNFQIFRPYKNHLIADLSQDIEHFVSKKHRQKARSSLREIQIEICNEPSQYLDDWIKLYDNLIKRHNITGIRAFSQDSFRLQMTTPGIILVAARLEQDIIGGMLIAIHREVAYTHLAAYADIAYNTNAAFGIYWTALKYLAEHNIHFVDLGAAAGIEEKEQDGLTRFKTGWSNTNRVVYFCGRIFDKQKYDYLCRQKNIKTNDYFPIYRNGEFY